VCTPTIGIGIRVGEIDFFWYDKPIVVSMCKTNKVQWWWYESKFPKLCIGLRESFSFNASV